MNINYLSDDDEKINTTKVKVVNVDVNDEENDEDDIIIDYIDDEYFNELDEDEQNDIIKYRELIFRKTILAGEKIQEKTLDNIEKIQKPDKINQKKNMNLLELHSFIENKIKEKKPKKFVSSRLLDKKKTNPENTGKINKVQISGLNTRKFNPRLPPYFFANKK